MRWIQVLFCLLFLAAAANADPIMMAPGTDPFHAGQFTTAGQVILPAGFFDPGSDPFGAWIELAGLPVAPWLGPSNANLQIAGFDGQVFLGPVPIGPEMLPGADTIVQRLGTALLPDGGSDTVPIEMVALHLASTQPIMVTHNGGQNPTPWDVRFDLTVPAQGNMTITRNGSTFGGTFEATLPIQYRLTLLPAQPSTADPPVAFGEDVILMRGTWELTEVPEPSVWLLMVTGLAGVAMGRRRRR